MGFRIHGLRAIAISTLVATASVTALAAPAVAADPAPSGSPVPTPAPSPSANPSAVPAPASPSPTAIPTASAVSAPTPAPVPAAAAPAPATAPRPDLAARVVRVGLNQRGDQYRWGSAGPSFFDCSGLVRYSYRKAGVSGRLGGGNSARGMYYWARLHGKTSRRNPRIGDVVVYGRGSHVAIYIGRGRVVHALNPRLDIRVTGLHAMTTPFTTFIHTQLPRGS